MKTFVIKKRFSFFIWVIGIVFLVIVGRLFYLHVVDRSRLVRIVERNRQKFEVKHARRGDILDKKGNVLATTRSFIELGVDPQLLREEDRTKWPALAKLINLDEKEIEKIFSEKTRKVKGPDGAEVKLVRWRKLVDALDEKKYEGVMKLKIAGVYGNRKFGRVYPMGNSAAHVLGFVNKETQAVCGVERFMDFYLNGQDGWKETECDGKRRELAQFRLREVEAVDGANVELTIDCVIQQVIEEEIKRIVKEYNPKSVSIIVSEPITGYLLGLANYPEYNPNEYWNYDVDSHRNRAVSDRFEPGSIFKIVSASAVLNDCPQTLEGVFDCSLDRAEYRGRIVKLPKDHKPMGKLTGREVIIKSSNRGVARMGMVLGEEKLYQYARAFGFGELTGYGAGGEVSGVVHPVEKWDGLTIGRFTMGHALSSTVLQLHYAFSVIANEGVLMEPVVVKRIFDEEGRTLATFSPKVKRKVLSTEIAEGMVRLMKEVVSAEGTSKRAGLIGFNVAGKTGTTQKIINGKYSNTHHISSFSGFFPAEAPQLLVTVVIDEAKMNGCAYGGVVAAPAFKNIGEQLAQYLSVQPNKINNNQLLAFGGCRR